MRYAHGATIRFIVVGAVLAALLGAAPVSAATFLIPKAEPIGSVGSTVPANGDVNPYGVAVVPRSVGRLVKGDVLVSNFNGRSNLQGTGTTIVQIAPTGGRHQFAAVTPAAVRGGCPGGVGLTAALVVLSSGWVIVGSLPTTDGTTATSNAGCLIVLDSSGRVAETFAGNGINGPWGMTALDGGGFADLFITNVLNGTAAARGTLVRGGTVVRLVLQIQGLSKPLALSETIIGSGFGERSDPDALVVGPTGVGLAPDGTLYVADTLVSRITAIPDATTRMTSAGIGHVVSTGGRLNWPLGLAIAPNRDIITVNGGNGDLVETTPAGTQVVRRTLDDAMGGAGVLFGVALTPDGADVYSVNDRTNTLERTFGCGNFPTCPILAAGTYRSTGFLPQITYTVPAGWASDVDRGDPPFPGEWRILPPGVTPSAVDAGTGDVVAVHVRIGASAADCSGTPQPGIGGKPGELAAYWATLPGLVMTPPKPASVGGLQASSRTSRSRRRGPRTAGMRPAFQTSRSSSGSPNTDLDWPMVPGIAYRVYLMNLDGGTLAIMTQDGTGGGHLDRYTPIIDGFHFGL